MNLFGKSRDKSRLKSFTQFDLVSTFDTSLKVPRRRWQICMKFYRRQISKNFSPSGVIATTGVFDYNSSFAFSAVFRSKIICNTAVNKFKTQLKYSFATRQTEIGFARKVAQQRRKQNWIEITMRDQNVRNSSKTPPSSVRGEIIFRHRIDSLSSQWNSIRQIPSHIRWLDLIPVCWMLPKISDNLTKCASQCYVPIHAHTLTHTTNIFRQSDFRIPSNIWFQSKIYAPNMNSFHSLSLFSYLPHTLCVLRVTFATPQHRDGFHRCAFSSGGRWSLVKWKCTVGDACVH